VLHSPSTPNVLIRGVLCNLVCPIFSRGFLPNNSELEIEGVAKEGCRVWGVASDEWRVVETRYIMSVQRRVVVLLQLPFAPSAPSASFFTPRSLLLRLWVTGICQSVSVQSQD
jgi:hypothetical protein